MGSVKGRILPYGALAGVALMALAQISCSGDGSASTESSSTELTEEEGNVAASGQFLATCDAGTGVIDGFVVNPDLEELLATFDAVPVIGDVLASADPSAIPVVGGFVPDPEGLPGDVLPVSAQDVEAMLPEGGVPADLPVIGKVAVTCGAEPVDVVDLPVPTDAAALIPVFDETDTLIGLVLVVVGDESSGEAPEVTTVELPEEAAGLLPAELGGAVSLLLGLLDLLV